jgi:hypothetical protein
MGPELLLACVTSWWRLWLSANLLSSIINRFQDVGRTFYSIAPHAQAVTRAVVLCGGPMGTNNRIPALCELNGARFEWLALEPLY